MAEIRLCWSNGAGGGPGAGLWQPDNAENRRLLTILMEEGCNAFGPGTHWIESRTSPI